MVRVLVCGGRYYENQLQLDAVLDRVHQLRRISTLIHGACITGADLLADQWACRNDVPVSRYPASWRILGKAAGPMRNQLMLDSGKPDGVIAFPGGRGTADMVRKAKAAGVPVMTIRE